jgi:hypothetical protein
MNDDTQDKFFGDWSEYKRARDDLFLICSDALRFPSQHEHERHFILAAARRTLSLEMSLRQTIDSRNGQMAMTIVRLNLDTLARFYALYWADETKGMTAESFAREVAKGTSIRSMKFLGGKEKATDQWLIQKIVGLGDWIPKVYQKTSGAIHFSDFHIRQLLQQCKPKKSLEDGSLQAEIHIGATENDPSPAYYRETQQAFFHILLMLIVAMKHRCEMVLSQ